MTSLSLVHKKSPAVTQLNSHKFKKEYDWYNESPHKKDKFNTNTIEEEKSCNKGRTMIYMDSPEPITKLRIKLYSINRSIKFI